MLRVIIITIIIIMLLTIIDYFLRKETLSIQSISK